MFKNPFKKHKAKPFEDEQTKAANIEMFEEACEFGDLAEAKRIIETTSINLYSGHLLALPLAARKGRFEVVKFLVDKGMPLDTDNRGALTYACEGGYLNIVQLLIDAGADLHANDNDALLNAAAHGHLDVVQYLVSKGADIHSGYEGALRFAATNGETDIVRYILDGWDVDLNGYFASKDTPLVAAVNSLNLETVKLLVERGAIPHFFVRDNSKASPLTLSIAMGSLEVISYLYFESIRQGISVNKEQLLIRACAPTVARRPDVVQFFIDEGVDIHTQNDEAFKSAVTGNELAVAITLFNEKPDYFSNFIRKDPDLSMRPNLVAMADHYNLHKIIGQETPKQRSRARL